MTARFARLPERFIKIIPRLTGSAVKLANVLAFHFDRVGRCWPSTRKLQEMAGLDDWRTFRRARSELEDYGLKTYKRGKGLGYEWPIFKSDFKKPNDCKSAGDKTCKITGFNDCKNAGSTACDNAGETDVLNRKFKKPKEQTRAGREEKKINSGTEQANGLKESITDESKIAEREHNKKRMLEILRREKEIK